MAVAVELAVLVLDTLVQAVNEKAKSPIAAIGRDAGRRKEQRRVDRSNAELFAGFMLRAASLLAWASRDDARRHTEFYLQAADGANLETEHSGRRGEPASHIRDGTICHYPIEDLTACLLHLSCVWGNPASEIKTAHDDSVFG